MAQQQGQRNSHLAMPPFDPTEIPECRDLAASTCAATNGCEYLDATNLAQGCVPKPRAFFNTVSHPNPTNDAKAVDALTTLAGQNPGDKLSGLMAQPQNRHWLASDMANEFRPNGVRAHPWVPTWRDSWDRQKVAEYVQNDVNDIRCAICYEGPDGTPCEQMKCCGSVFHIVCSKQWFQNPNHTHCPGCNTAPPQNNAQQYNMKRHIPSDTIRSSSVNGCIHLASQVAGNNNLCEIDFAFAVDVAKIASGRTLLGHHTEHYLEALAAHVEKLVSLEGYVIINPTNAAGQARSMQLMRLALEMQSEVEIRYHLTPTNQHQLPVVFERGQNQVHNDLSFGGVMKVYCATVGHTVGLQEITASLHPVGVVGLRAYAMYCPVVATAQQLVDFIRGNREEMAVGLLLATASIVNSAFEDLASAPHNWRDLSGDEIASLDGPNPGIRSAGRPCTVVRRGTDERLCFINFGHHF